MPAVGWILPVLLLLSVKKNKNTDFYYFYTLKLLLSLIKSLLYPIKYQISLINFN